MKLIDDLFVIQKYAATGRGFTASIHLDPAHVVYQGHFPGHPVTPGVVQMQIVHELLERQLEKKLRLVQMPQCKFVRILDPTETALIDVHVELSSDGGRVRVKAWGEHGSAIFFRLNSTYEAV
jgi:3-hydroxyacyl-[acyl-carrier-protein] dehydratase